MAVKPKPPGKKTKAPRAAGGRPKQQHDKRTPEALGFVIGAAWNQRATDGDVWKEMQIAVAEVDSKFAAMPRTLKNVERWQAELQEARAPFEKQLLAIEQRRQEEDNSDLLPFGDGALAQLRLLRETQATITQEQGKDSPQYKAFMVGTFVPAYNRMSTTDRLCANCFARFALLDPRARYCSDTCSAAVRNRGRKHDGLSEVARSERARRRVSDALDRHAARCQLCQLGEPCVTRERLHGRLEPYAKAWQQEALEAAQAGLQDPSSEDQ
jgi:hypothetical protein